MNTYKAVLKVQVFVKKDTQGYHAFCPLFEGLHVGGDTKEEALNNAKDAVEAYICSLIKHNEPIPAAEIVPIVPFKKKNVKQFGILDCFNLKNYSENYIFANIGI